MRTTVTLDLDVAQKLKKVMGEQGITMKEALNQTLRHGFRSAGGADGSRKPFRVKPHDLGFKPGIDLNKLNQLVGELEDEEILAKMLQDQTR